MYVFFLPPGVSILNVFSQQLQMAQTKMDDGRVGSRIENYAGFWQKDIKEEAQADSDVRVENYTDVVNGTIYPIHFRS